MTEYHPVVKTITDMLRAHGAWFETFEHGPVRTSAEAAAVRPEYSLRQGAKALIVKYRAQDGGKRFAMLVIPGDCRYDAKKAKALLHTADLTFATEQEVGNVTSGVQAGGVPPFGNLFGLDVYADPSVFANEKIIFNAGDRRYSVAMKSEDYKSLANPTVMELI